MLCSYRDDKNKLCLFVAKCKNVRCYPSFDITYTLLHSAWFGHVIDLLTAFDKSEFMCIKKQKMNLISS